MHLKSFSNKDRYGNMLSVEFFEPEATVPTIQTIDHPGQPKGTDTVPAWLTPGEFVMNAESVRMFEPEIEAMNNAGRAVQATQGGSIPEYASDGMAVPKPRPKMPEIPPINPQQLYKMLRERGFSDNAARGIIGNFHAESKLDPDARQLKGGPGRGLAQWEKGGRFDTDPLNLVDFAAAQERSWKDPDVQLDFMLAEMDNSQAFGDVRTAMNNADTPGEAAKIFLTGYEKANPEHETYQDSMKNRMAFATNLEIDEPSVFARLAGLFGSTPAVAAELPENMSETTEQSVPLPNQKVPPKPPEVSKEPIETSDISDLLMAARAQYKSSGGATDDDDYRSQWEALKKLAQQATATQGSYIGDEVLEEGGTNYDAQRHAEEILMMRDMKKNAAIAEDAAANEAAMLEASVPPPEMKAPPAPPVVTPEVRSINKFGKVTNYQKEGGKWYRIKSDGSLAKDPASGLTAANLNNQESPITGEGTAEAVPMPEGNLPIGSRGSGEYLDTKTDNRVPKPEAAPPKPKDNKTSLPEAGKTWLDPSSNIVYTVDEYGRLLNSYGHPAPMGVQDTFTQMQAGLLNEVDADQSKVVKPYEKTVDALAQEAIELKNKAQDEVKETGQVSQDTAVAIAQNKGQTTQVTKVEDDEAAAIEAKRLEEATENRDNLMSQYEEAQRIAAASGVTDFPDFETWKQKQGHGDVDTNVETDDTSKTGSTSANTGKQSEVLKAVVTELETVNDNSADGTTTADASKAVAQAGDDGQVMTDKAESWLSGIFGDLFDAKELKRMAILYAGSRLMGASHGGSLNFAAKQYLTRVDAKAATHTAQVNALVKAGKHTPKSIAAYKKSKDPSVLVPIGKPILPTSDRKEWYTPEGQRVMAQKYKIGEGAYIWSTDGGKSAIPSSWHDDAARVPKTDKYNDRIRAEVPLLKDSIEELSLSIGDVVPGDSERGIKRTQKTSITPTNAAMEAAEWAAKNGIDVASMNTYVEQAYRMAVQQAGGDNKTKPNSLLPYLNQLKLRQDVGVHDLFMTTDDDGTKVGMDAVKVEELSTQFLRMTGLQGSPSDTSQVEVTLKDGRKEVVPVSNRDRINLFWTQAAEIWNKKLQETPDIYKQYQKKALAGETPFYVYAKEQLGLPIG